LQCGGECAKREKEVKKVQAHALIHVLDDPANEAWADKVSEKYGPWRPAHSSENDIPCDVELVIGG
jgi:hypothetical protein